MLGKKFWPKTNVGSKKIFGLKKFGPEIKVGDEKNLGTKKIGSEKILGPKFFDVVLVLLVTWTPNPLYSAKSP